MELENKSFYEFIVNGMIFQVEKSEDLREESIRLFLQNCYKVFSSEKRKEDLSKSRMIELSTKNQNIFYSIFKNAYIENLNGGLLYCEDIDLFIHIDRDKKEMEIKELIIGCMEHDAEFKNFDKIDIDTFKTDIGFIFPYEDENEILEIMHNNIERVFSKLIIDKDLKLYKRFNRLGIIGVTDFVRLFNKIEDEKRIKNYLVDKKFK